MDTRKTSRGTSSFLLAAIVLGGLIVLNLLAQNHFFRIDLTEDRQYTLTEATRTRLSGLDDVVNIKVYFSSDLPTYLVTLTQQVGDLLDEYQAYGKENLLIEWEDPSGDPELERRVRLLGIPQVQLNIIEQDKAQIANAYLGIAVLYEDRHEAIPVVQGVENLEYDLTAAIIKVYQEEAPRIALVGGTPEATKEAGLATAFELLGRQYDVIEFDLATGDLLPDDVETLILVMPDGLSERSLYVIDQFVMRGGELLLFHDPIVMADGAISAAPRTSGLRPLLEHYGILVGENLVLDRYSEFAAFNQGFLTFTIAYPFWPKVQRTGFDQTNPIVNQLEGIVLPWCSSVASAAEPPDSVQVDTLLSSSPYAWLMTGRYDLNPQQRFPDQPREPQDPYPMAIVAAGPFPSYFEGKAIPEKLIPGGEDVLVAASGEAEMITHGMPTRIVVVGTGNAILDNMINQFGANSLFLQNAVDWLTLGEDLISIRSRGATDRPLKDLSERAKTGVRFLVTFGIPLLVTLFGIVRWAGRRRKSPASFLGEVGS